jgi:hypothetical protein
MGEGKMDQARENLSKVLEQLADQRLRSHFNEAMAVSALYLASVGELESAYTAALAATSDRRLTKYLQERVDGLVEAAEETLGPERAEELRRKSLELDVTEAVPLVRKALG